LEKAAIEKATEKATTTEKIDLPTWLNLLINCQPPVPRNKE
jgi:hypothetical protein